MCVSGCEYRLLLKKKRIIGIFVDDLFSEIYCKYIIILFLFYFKLLCLKFVG